jgi:1-acyl-sn-glycerol-3-phosphate acyltransferase
MPTEPLYRSLVLLGRGVFRALALDLRVQHGERLDQPGGAVLAITHFGYLDFALAEWVLWQQNRRLTRFLATARAFEHPIAGRLLREMRHIPVERTAGAAAYRHAVAALKAGEVIGVFPEGQVNAGVVGPLKSGAVRMAAQAGVPVIPVVVWGGQRILTKGRRFSLRRARHSIVVIAIGEPRFPGRSADDAEVQTTALHGALQALVNEAESLTVTIRSASRGKGGFSC